LPVNEIILSDFKNFEFKGEKFGIGQVETVDLSDLSSKEDEILIELKKMQKEKSYHTIILFITDIINEGSKFLIASEDIRAVEQALKTKTKNNKVYIKGIISRKKQVLPMFNQKFNI